MRNKRRSMKSEGVKRQKPIETALVRAGLNVETIVRKNKKTVITVSRSAPQKRQKPASGKKS